MEKSITYPDAPIGITCSDTGHLGEVHGLTKREYFAAMAMQGLCNEGAWSGKIQKQAEAEGSNSSIAIALYAVDLADELIKALNNS